MPVEHVGELAELYALGTLDPVDGKRIERHLRDCGACAARVGEAESTVTRLIEADAAASPEGTFRTPVFRRRSVAVPTFATPLWAAAVAAAFVAGLLVPAFLHGRPETGNEQQASVAMLAGHFGHVALRPRVANAPKAKAIYPLEGGWIYVIVDAGPRLAVRVLRAGMAATVASLPPSGDVRTAFARVDGPIEAVELLEDGRVVSVGRIAR